MPPDPYKPGPKTPLRDLSVGSSPKYIKVDIAHTYAIAGYGKDDLASTIIFLAVRCRVWGAANYPTQLERAWMSFKSWCVAKKKYTTILEFSNKELKVTSFLCHHGKAFGCIDVHPDNCPRMSRMFKPGWPLGIKPKSRMLGTLLDRPKVANVPTRSWEGIRCCSGVSMAAGCVGQPFH